MTQLWKDPGAISNVFDEIERGIGKRGSTFTDVDAVSHDLDTRRFLFREFKREGEELSRAQRWVLAELSHLPRCTVWLLRLLDDGRIVWGQFGAGHGLVVITRDEYRRLLACWWHEQPIVPTPAPEPEPDAVPPAPAVPGEPVAPITAADIRWTT